MQYIEPNYYREFSCLADKCQKTCCAGWQIVVDQASMEKYLQLQSQGKPFGNRLCNGIDWKEGVFYQDQKKRCEFLNEDNLCDIYSEVGAAMLCDTCRTYPRHIEEFEGIREHSLCLSCPEAARIILNKEERIIFVETGDDNEEYYEDFDEFLFAQLVLAREYLLEVLQDRRYKMTRRMAVALECAKELQECVNSNEIYRCEEVIDKYRNKQVEKQGLQEITDLLVIQRLWNPFLEELEVLQEGWYENLEKSKKRLYLRGQTYYEELQHKFECDYPEWEIECEQLMVYWIFAYFGGAVYDDNIIGKVWLALVSTLLIRELAVAKYHENGGCFSKVELLEICINYSREIEHNDVNIEIIETNVINGK